VSAHLGSGLLTFWQRAIMTRGEHVHTLQSLDQTDISAVITDMSSLDLLVNSDYLVGLGYD
jgi:hypothetical protein